MRMGQRSLVDNAQKGPTTDAGKQHMAQAMFAQMRCFIQDLVPTLKERVHTCDKIMDQLSRTPRQPGVTASAVGSSHSSITIGLRWLRLCGNCILAQSSNHDSNGALLPGKLLEPRRVPRHMHEEKEKKKAFHHLLWVCSGKKSVERGLTQEPLSRSEGAYAGTAAATMFGNGFRRGKDSGWPSNPHSVP